MEINNKMKIGATLLFKDKNNQRLKGVLKSVVIDSNINDIMKSAKLIGNEVSSYYKYDYLGVNDLFSVSGEAKEGEVLGRTTFYKLNSSEESESLIMNKDLFLDKGSISKMFNCALVYFCENDDEKYTISVLSIVKSDNERIIFDVESLAKSNTFLEKIKSNSIENINKIEFVGIEEVFEIDLKFNIFQSFYSDFASIEIMKEELLSNDEVAEVLGDIWDDN